MDNYGVNQELLNLQHAANGEEYSDEMTFPYVIFTVYTNTFAMNCKYVQSIEPTPPQTTEVSQSSPEIRGVTYYKEQAINLIDLRRVLGIMDHEEYLASVVDIPQRIQEHEDFVRSLEDSIMSGEDITVNPDPHKCNLGKWLDKYEPITHGVKTHIENIIEPHNMLHTSVRQIIHSISFKQEEETRKLMDEIKYVHSKAVVDGLLELEKMMINEKKELVLIVKVGTKTLGLVVDTTESIEPIDNIQMLPESVIVSDYVKRYGLRNKDDSLLLILEPSAFL